MEPTAKDKIILVVFGAAAGFVNGFLGGGGGVIVVALLLAVLKLHQKYAQATALLTVLPLTAVSAAVYIWSGNVQWVPTLWTSLGVAAGGAVGALLLNKIKGNAAKIVFAVTLILGGIKMFF